MTLHELWDFLMPYQRKWLGFCILFSLGVHIGAFFLFETFPSGVFPNSRYQPRIYFFNFQQTSSTRQGAGWLDLLDPRRMALPLLDRHQIALEAQSLDQKHAREWMQLEDLSFERKNLALPIVEPMQELSTRVMQSLATVEARPMPLLLEAPPRLAGSVAQFATPLSARPLLRHPQLPQPHSATLLGVSVLRIGVNAQGEVLYLLLEDSCGERGVDQLALQKLREWRFAPSQVPLEWGRVTVFWDLKSLKNE